MACPKSNATRFGIFIVVFHFQVQKSNVSFFFFFFFFFFYCIKKYYPKTYWLKTPTKICFAHNSVVMAGHCVASVSLSQISRWLIHMAGILIPVIGNELHWGRGPQFLSICAFPQAEWDYSVMGTGFKSKCPKRTRHGFIWSFTHHITSTGVIEPSWFKGRVHRLHL